MAKPNFKTHPYNVKMEVRCCCVPQKLLGWLPVPYPNLKSVRYWLVHPSAKWAPKGSETGETALGEYLEMRLEDYLPEGAATPYRAIKAEGIPLETLRRIPLFQENRT